MKRQRVTLKKFYTNEKVCQKDRPSNPLKGLTLSLFILASLLMTGSTAFLYRHGFDALEFYSNMANPYMKLVTIPAGLRREEIVEKFAKILSWDQNNINAFIKTAPQDDRGYLDGYYLPGSYWVKITATGEDVAHQMLQNFNSQVSTKILAQNKDVLHSTKKAVTPISKKNVPLTNEQKINLDTAVRVASIIQKEAAGPVDMKLISGVIWNRLFKGMTLDIDATLQYAKANRDSATSTEGAVGTTDWWPTPMSKDKFIDSPFNTYQNKGLPPIAIANPSVEAINAAFNPSKTDCLFYLHDNNRGIHCSKTYQAHKDNVQKYLVGSR